MREDLSVSSRLLKVPEVFQTSLQKDQSVIELPERVLLSYRYEPFRLKLSYMIARLQALLDQPDAVAQSVITVSDYDEREFLADLTVVKESLLLAKLGSNQRLDDLCARLKTFGFHLAALDIRQHSSVHEHAVSELLKIAGVAHNYAQLDEASKIAILHRELQTSRPLVYTWEALSPVTDGVLKTLRLIRTALQRDPNAIGSYVVSMTHQVSDLLEGSGTLDDVF